MGIKALESLSSSPIEFAQSVISEKNANTLEGAQANLAKKQVEGEAGVSAQLIQSATQAPDGRKLLAKA